MVAPRLTAGSREVLWFTGGTAHRVHTALETSDTQLRLNGQSICMRACPCNDRNERFRRSSVGRFFSVVEL
jgi:hypothetical protein